VSGVADSGPGGRNDVTGAVLGVMRDLLVRVVVG